MKAMGPGLTAGGVTWKAEDLLWDALAHNGKHTDWKTVVQGIVFYKEFVELKSGKRVE